jgi:DNA mismatch endonuclease, patch repair protein
MTSQRRRDTKGELELRSLLHRRGLRFRVHALLPGLRRRSDIVFTRARVAVFVDGCFWHGCPEHGSWPKQNADWWREKIEANQRRDRDTDARLKAAGWTVIRVWEHDDPTRAADRIVEVVRRAIRLREGVR